MGVKQNVPYLKTVPIPNPAAGSDFTLSPTGSEWWRVISLAFRLVTDANVANRTVTIRANDQTSTYFIGVPLSQQTAGQTIDYGAAQSGSLVTIAATLQTFALPDNGLLLQPNGRLVSSTSGIQVGDQFSAICALVEAFPNGPYFEWAPTIPRAQYARS